MTDSWRYPVEQASITNSYVLELVKQAEENGPKAQAFDTITRYSSAKTCAAQIGYWAAGYDITNPTDSASLSVMDLGTVLHELLQEAIGRRYPDAQFEVPTRIGDLTSGHCDALVEIDGQRIIFEFKSQGAYPYHEAIGFKPATRGNPAHLENPKGPKLSYIVQAGLNAYANKADTVVIGYYTKAPISAPQAGKAGLRNVDRLLAEWWIPKGVWLPLVEEELERLKAIKATVASGYRPDRQDFDDDGRPFTPDPNVTVRGRAGYSWRCNGYCPFTDQCVADGAEGVRISNPIREAS